MTPQVLGQKYFFTVFILLMSLCFGSGCKDSSSKVDQEGKDDAQDLQYSPPPGTAAGGSSGSTSVPVYPALSEPFVSENTLTSDPNSNGEGPCLNLLRNPTDSPTSDASFAMKSLPSPRQYFTIPREILRKSLPTSLNISPSLATQINLLPSSSGDSVLSATALLQSSSADVNSAVLPNPRPVIDPVQIQPTSASAQASQTPTQIQEELIPPPVGNQVDLLPSRPVVETSEVSTQTQRSSSSKDTFTQVESTSTSASNQVNLPTDRLIDEASEVSTQTESSFSDASTQVGPNSTTVSTQIDFLDNVNPDGTQDIDRGKTSIDADNSYAEDFTYVGDLTHQKCEKYFGKGGEFSKVRTVFVESGVVHLKCLSLFPKKLKSLDFTDVKIAGGTGLSLQKSWEAVAELVRQRPGWKSVQLRLVSPCHYFTALVTSNSNDFRSTEKAMEQEETLHFKNKALRALKEARRFNKKVSITLKEAGESEKEALPMRMDRPLITHLYIIGQQISTDSARLFDLIFPKLSLLRMVNVKIDNEALVILGETSSNLVTLEIIDSKLNDAEAITIANGNWKSLTSLDLNSNRIGKAGIIAIAQAFKRGNLTFLNLANNSLAKIEAQPILQESGLQINSDLIQNNLSDFEKLRGKKQISKKFKMVRGSINKLTQEILVNSSSD